MTNEATTRDGSVDGRLENARCMATNIINTPANEQALGQALIFCAQAIRDLADCIQMVRESRTPDVKAA
jgi:hypothetical protein